VGRRWRRASLRVGCLWCHCSGDGHRSRSLTMLPSWLFGCFANNARNLVAWPGVPAQPTGNLALKRNHFRISQWVCPAKQVQTGNINVDKIGWHRRKGMSELTRTCETCRTCRNFFWFLHVKKYWWNNLLQTGLFEKILHGCTFPWHQPLSMLLLISKQKNWSRHKISGKLRKFRQSTDQTVQTLNACLPWAAGVLGVVAGMVN
jgi:hypothetical protein